MSLIASPRHAIEDLGVWTRAERIDAINARRWAAKLASKAATAAEAARVFAAADGCYAGCSWGKDSVTLAHILHSHGIAIPIVWVRVDPVENPDCPLVRNAFLARFPVDYHEIAVTHDPKARRTSLPGFEQAASQFGDRHISGVRAQESRARRLRTARWGVSTERTCAPLSRWTAAEVFAYLHTHDLPVHPAYAQSVGGLLDREHLRVGALGGSRGTGHGRREWEQRYYREELAAISRT